MSLVVVSPGPLTLVEDGGRPGYADIGVPHSGAFDRRAWHMANRLVGNRESSAVLESLGGGLVVEVVGHTTLAVTGAHGDVRVGTRIHSTGQPLHVPPGHRVTLGPPRSGLRYYVAVAGGLALPTVLGSQSSDTLGRLGPRIQAGDTLPVGPYRGSPVVDHIPTAEPAHVFDVTAGPDLPPGPLLDAEWDLDPQSNRIGVRLRGRPLAAPSAGLPSKPMVLGAVQLPPNGQPIILGPDHPTTGGYPVIAVVTPESMNDVAQWSGGPRTFRLVR